MSTTACHPWLDRAFADLGTSASSSPDDAAQIRGYFADAGHPEITDDAVAWCAAFAGACLERSGIASTRSLLARSYLSYGAPLAVCAPGAIAVFSRGADPTLGHVGFAVGETADSILVLGGNQGHAVTVAQFPRASLLALRWPPAAAEASPPVPAPAPPAADDPAFARALAHVLRMEGGYTDDPYDPGGPTNLGITIDDLAAFRGVPKSASNAAELKSQVQSLTPADVGPVYRALYWVPCQAPALPPPLALFHFDTAVNHGLASAARMLQGALDVGVDGEIGPLTLAAAAGADPAAAISAYADGRRARYRALPTFWRFGNGWLARVDATETAALVSSRNPSRNPFLNPSQSRRPV